MLNSGKKIRALRDKKKIRTLVLSEKKFLNETKNHNPPPPLQLKWSVLYIVAVSFIGGANRSTRRKKTDLAQVTYSLHHIMWYRVHLA
jgi:hypothetical protein